MAVRINSGSLPSLLFSGKSNPDVWEPCGQIGIAGLKVRLCVSFRAAEFYRGRRFVRVYVYEVMTKGELWVIRKLFRFRRYAKRMERQDA
jgi:hypothetical protein